MRIIIVTGLSGAGKTTAIRAFEDRGLFCIDNPPVTLIPDLIKSMDSADNPVDTVVLGIDTRELSFLADYGRVALSLKEAGHRLEIVFLEARDEILIRRFSETRRRHPLAGVDIRVALEREKELLSPLRAQATTLIDTSTMTVHELKHRVQTFEDAASDKRTLSVTLMSFGFKYGVPLEADLVFDARFLPNPYFIENLKPKTGLDDEVFDYVMGFEESGKLLDHLESLLMFSLPLFEREGKTYLTVAVGCTGGKHRSISMVEALNAFFKEKMPDYLVFVRHRDITR